jgi:GT2 family glycosyltransferase
VRLERNVGWCATFNRCYERLDGEYGVLISDDDELLPDLLEATVAVLDRHPHVGMVHTGFDSATLPERRLAPTLKMLGASVGRYPRLALKPEAWRLVGASLLGPRVVARMGGR